jgi:opacity protein-like surface antigen
MRGILLTTAAFVALWGGVACAQDLEKGGFEVRASGGVNAGSRPVEGTSPSFAVEGAYGLSRFVAVTGSYTHDFLNETSSLFCTVPGFLSPGVIPSGCNRVDLHSRIREFMGGVRLSVPNSSRITPYVRLSIGAVRQTTDSSPPAPFAGSTDKTEFGFAPGAGLDFKLTRHFGVGADATYVKADRFTGFYHVTGGVFFRF